MSPEVKDALKALDVWFDSRALKPCDIAQVLAFYLAWLTEEQDSPDEAMAIMLRTVEAYRKLVRGSECGDLPN